ncbi:MAG: alanine--tRNA ligase [Armatimonadota bacterium]|nr:alanine--tRNA ligase [Armatimonadota bacterium]MDR7403787.1 alanine--tRNA ligase [Armatimonadota bacterium]
MAREERWPWQVVADTFLEYFRERGHTIVPSSSLVPAGDPTLLFTNAGMVQFKDVFLGREQRSYRRAASLQKCMRVQGKHNDLDNVGPSPRHHTFFFMLGNFSFGDYFKREAVAYAWDLLTGRYGLDPDRLVVTVHHADREAAEAWREVGVPSERVVAMGDATNFWMMAETGPCGPTSELHYDWGPEHCTCGRADCSVALDNGCLRWLEVWNLVFMQYEQRPDGTRVPLPRPGVDTGMGLERITSVLQGVNDDYATDLFTPLLDRLQVLLGHDAAGRHAHRVAYRVLADHGRAMAFLMADGVVPGNEGRGYVLRMVMRRAMRFARAAGVSHPLLADLADAVVDLMGERYPELASQREFIRTVARQEEERFAQTLAAGLQKLDELVAATLARGHRVLAGEDVFRLYDTYGFPLEMTRDVARERGLTVDESGFARALEAQRERARAAQAFGLRPDERRYAALAEAGVTSEFIGYRRLRARARVLAVLVPDGQVQEAREGAEVEVVLDRTPFYPEGGGQVGDTGVLAGRDGEVEVTDTQRPLPGLIVHRGRVVRGRIRAGQSVRAAVDQARRWDIMRNHTATHLLHRALREVLGEHARQAGSLVAPDRLRFDFVHTAPLTAAQRAAVEERVNEQILADLPVRARWMSLEDALRLGAVALFGEKYGDRVRVVSIADYSRELCGGTHLSRTSQAGLFKVTAESGVAAGIRRVEAVTGRGVLALLRQQEATLRALSERLRAGPEELVERVARLLERERDLERELRTARARASAVEAVPAVVLDGTTVVVADTDLEEPADLRAEADRLRARLDQQRVAGVVVVASSRSGAVVATRTTAVTPPVDAGRLVRLLVERFGGRGGGRPTLGQGGLRDRALVGEMVRASRDPAFLRTLLEQAREEAAGSG